MYGIYINHIINNNNSTNAIHSPVGTLYCQSLYIYILYETNLCTELKNILLYLSKYSLSKIF